MQIPGYNFYYLADATHNPQRATRWTDVYLDPAGHGWMMSAIQPVYAGDFLEGVVGLDITVDGILDEIGKLKVPWGGYLMLVSGDMKIMALPPEQSMNSCCVSPLAGHAESTARRSLEV